MGLFSKIKSMFQKKETTEENKIIETEVNELDEVIEKVYEKDTKPMVGFDR